MPRKHYEMIARRISETADRTRTAHAKMCLRNLAETLAIDLHADNPRFDRERFLKACGL